MELWFSGDLVLRLAQEGRIAIDEETADSLIEELTTTLNAVSMHATVLRAQLRPSWPTISKLYPAIAQLCAEALRQEHQSPGCTELALRELPKYIAALQVAKATFAVQ